MRYHRADVVDRAVDVLDRYGLADLTMRRLGRELGVQPSALYHHFPDKQTLLAAVADELLARGRRLDRTRRRPEWSEQIGAICHEVRDAALAYRDGAEVIAAASAFGLGATAPVADLREVLVDAGFPETLAAVGARTLMHFVLGHAVDEQTHLQAGSAGAIADDPRESGDFDTGLGLIVAGLHASLAAVPASAG